MPIYDPGVETHTTFDDDPPGYTWRSGRVVRVGGPRGPLLTLVTRFLWRFGLFCVLTSPVWALPIMGLPQAEGLSQPWGQNYATTLAAAMFLASLGAGLILVLLGTRPGWLLLPAIAVAIVGFGAVTDQNIGIWGLNGHSDQSHLSATRC